jgi:hypothetical protein
MRVKNIFKRLFRVYGHMYHSHVESIIALGAEAHLNTCFKHFMYFILEFGLVERKELEPLVEICMVRSSPRIFLFKLSLITTLRGEAVSIDVVVAI